MYTPRTSVEAIPNASIHHSALQNRDFGHTYDRSRALVRALSHVKIKGVYTSKKTPQYSGVLRYTIAEYEGVNRLFHIRYVINAPGYRLSINIPRTRCVHVRVHG